MKSSFASSHTFKLFEFLDEVAIESVALFLVIHRSGEKFISVFILG